ncbi:DsbA family protein [Erysipelotrichaceae bacterium OttesenSCG-928-M19]|nr:DsbA family protein [Erysipelotrichaceae bacterium OttesenSCG-928-M19]
MNYLITNPFCPYCYGNDRVLERELPNLTDEDLMLLPYTLTPDVQEFDDRLYNGYLKAFNNDTLPYLETLDIPLPKYYKKENISPSKLVFITYYYLREKKLGLKFYHEVTREFFQNDLNYSDIEQLSKIVENLGIKKEDYLQALENPIYEQQYLNNLEDIDDMDIESVPSYIIDDEILVGIKKGITKIKSQ